MSKRISMEDLTCIAKMNRDGKSYVEIAKALDLVECTVQKYITVMDGTREGRKTWADNKVNMPLIRQFLKIDGAGSIKDEKKEETRVSEVRKVVKKDEGMTIDMARKIATELDWKTPVGTLSRLTGISVEDINRIQAYLKLLSEKESEKAITYKSEGRFSQEIYDTLEKWAGFTPKVKTREEKEQDYQKELLAAIDTISDFQDMIHDDIKAVTASLATKDVMIEILRPIQGDIIKMTAAINEYTKASRELNQSVRLLVNANLNNKR